MSDIRFSTPDWHHRLSVLEAVDLLEQCGILPPSSKRPHGPLRIDPLHWLAGEVEAGRLVFHDHAGAQIEPGEYEGYFGLYDETTSRVQLNAWLERIGHLKRIPETGVPAAVTQEDHPEATTTHLPEPAALPVEPAQAAAPTVGRRGLPAPQAAAIFSSRTAVGWNGDGWMRAFQDPGKWLAQHRVASGKKGGHKHQPSTWCPIGIACALVEGKAGRQGRVLLKIMHAKFMNRPELAPWRDEWERYFMRAEAGDD